MAITQYLHFPKGNGSYIVAENLSKNIEFINGLWAIGEKSSDIYMENNFPVFFSHPQTKGKRFLELSYQEYKDYQKTIKNSLDKIELSDVALVHHGFVLSKLIAKESTIISYLHGTELLSLQKCLPEYVKADIYEGIANSNKVLVMSTLQKELAEELLAGYLTSDVEIIGGGVDTNIFYHYPDKTEIINEYSLDPNKKIVLFAGRLTYEKGLDELIESFSSPTFSTDKQLVIVGNGVLYHGLKEMTNNKNINVKFIQNQSQKNLAKLMSSADVFVLPSHYESFGLVCLEALACETPLVTSNVGILKELVNPPFGGAVFERTNYKEETILNLQKAVTEVLSRERKAYNAQFRNVIENYSWQKISTKLEKIINPLLIS